MAPGGLEPVSIPTRCRLGSRRVASSQPRDRAATTSAPIGGIHNSAYRRTSLSRQVKHSASGQRGGDGLRTRHAAWLETARRQSHGAGGQAIMFCEGEGGETMVIELPKVRIGEKLYYRDDRLREFRAVDNPHDRVTFKEIMQLYISVLCELSNALNTLEKEL